METSFLPGRVFASPADFNTQLIEWLSRQVRQTITDQGHVQTAAGLRSRFQAQQRPTAARHHTYGHPVAIRALTDYDVLFGVNFNPARPGPAAEAT